MAENFSKFVENYELRSNEFIKPKHRKHEKKCVYSKAHHNQIAFNTLEAGKKKIHIIYREEQLK